MAEDQTTGTPGAMQEGADDATASSGTPAASTDGGDARADDAENERIRKLEEIREKYLANLETVAQANDILRAQREQASRAATPPTGYDPAAQRVARASQLIQSIGERDPELAQAMTELVGLSYAETQAKLQQAEVERRFDRELDSVPAADRAEVERRARANGWWPSIALKDLKSERFDNERDEIAEQRRKIQEQADKQKRGVVRTDAAPAPPAPANNGEVTAEQWAQIVRNAASGSVEDRKKVRDYDEGRLKIRSG